MSVFDAERICQNYGDGLALVKTTDQRQKLRDFIGSFNTGLRYYFTICLNSLTKYLRSSFLDTSAYYWIGASDIGHQAGQFYWRDGTKVDDSLWAAGNPNDFKVGQRTCINMAFSTGLLADYNCSAVYSPVCHLGSS